LIHIGDTESLTYLNDKHLDSGKIEKHTLNSRLKIGLEGQIKRNRLIVC